MRYIKKIRPIAIALIEHNGSYLVIDGFDPVKNKGFYRPLGGGIEFGETGEAAVKRELAEELGAELENIKKMAVFENIFVYRGLRLHEIVFVYSADFVDKEMYKKDKFKVLDKEDSSDVIWVDKEDLKEKIVPEGIAEYIK